MSMKYSETDFGQKFRQTDKWMNGQTERHGQEKDNQTENCTQPELDTDIII